MLPSLSLLLSTALAQAPAAPTAPLSVPAALPTLKVDAPALDPARQREALEDAVLLRWPDGKETSLELKKGDAVELVAAGDSGLVRVRKGTDFGWIDASKLGPVSAAPAVTPTP